MNATCLSASVCSCGRPHGSRSLPVMVADLAVNLEKAVQQFVAAGDQHLGHLEAEVLRQTQELQRRAVEAGAQAKADATPPCCPVCHQKLTRLTHGHQRAFRTRFGPVTLRRTRGQGERAQSVRQKLDVQAVRASTAQLELSLEPYQMIIELDAWNIRERDDWGRTERLRRDGGEPGRWHWV